MTIITTLLENPFIQTLIIGGAGWLVNKIAGAKKSSTTAKAGAALATSAAIMMQLALTETGKTPTEMIAMFKGVIAIQFAKVGFTETQRAPFQPLIDRAISEAVTHWVTLHPSPTSIRMPLVAKLA